MYEHGSALKIKSMLLSIPTVCLIKYVFVNVIYGYTLSYEYLMVFYVHGCGMENNLLNEKNRNISALYEY